MGGGWGVCNWPSSRSVLEVFTVTAYSVNIPIVTTQVDSDLGASDGAVLYIFWVAVNGTVVCCLYQKCLLMSNISQFKGLEVFRHTVAVLWWRVSVWYCDNHCCYAIHLVDMLTVIPELYYRLLLLFVWYVMFMLKLDSVGRLKMWECNMRDRLKCKGRKCKAGKCETTNCQCRKCGTDLAIS